MDDIKIIVTGDFCPQKRMEKLCREGKYENIYNDVLPILKDKDLSITNLECPLTAELQPTKKSGPNLNGNPISIEGIKYGGFDVVSLANNHIFDHGETGLTKTVELCRGSGLGIVGAGKNLEEASNPIFYTIKGRKIAIISYAENEFGIAGDNKAGVNPLNPISNYYQIQEVKKKADLVFVLIHGGSEFYSLPSPKMVETYRFFADLNVTAIFGHHSHCSTGYEIYNNVPIFYSLGNFIFDWKNIKYEPWYEGYFVKIRIHETRIDDISLVPYFQFKDELGLRRMTVDKERLFIERINKYSKVILDPFELKKEWYRYCTTRRNDYLFHLLNLNKVQKFFLKKGILSDFITRKAKNLSLLNVIRCESHREVTLQILKNISENN